MSALRVTAREAFWMVAPAPAERVIVIEAALERLDDLRDRLIAKLDGMSADPDLKPSLGFPESAIDQSAWGHGDRFDLELESDFEPDDVLQFAWPNAGDQPRISP